MTTSEPSETSESHLEREQRIRERAYALWEEEGSAPGRAEEYWLRARELTEDETKSAYPPAQSRGHRT